MGDVRTGKDGAKSRGEGPNRRGAGTRTCDIQIRTRPLLVLPLVIWSSLPAQILDNVQQVYGGQCRGDRELVLRKGERQQTHIELPPPEEVPLTSLRTGTLGCSSSLGQTSRRPILRTASVWSSVPAEMLPSVRMAGSWASWTRRLKISMKDSPNISRMGVRRTSDVSAM